MKLLRLHIDNFGTLSDFRMELDGGLNVLHRENGWGKSTLAVFIKAMLYGLPATTKRSLDENERKRYTPWQGGAFGGSIEFSTEKGDFRAERYFGAKESMDSFVLYDLSTHLESDAYPSNLGEALFGIDADGYERSAYLSQRGMLVAGNATVTARLSSLLDNVSDVGSFEDACERLERRSRAYATTGERGLIYDTERAITRQEREAESMRQARDTLVRLREERAGMEREAEDARADLEETRAALRRAGDARARAALRARARDAEAQMKELRAQRDALDEKMHSHHPTDDEISAARATRNALSSAREGANAIPEVRSPRLSTLPEDGSCAPPDEATLLELKRCNGTLQNLAHREAALRARLSVGVRFPKGAPDEEGIAHAARALDEAERLRREALPAAPTGGSTVLIAAAILGFVAAIVLFCLGALPAFAALSAVLLPLGGVAFALGFVCSLLQMRSRRRATEAAHAAAKEEKERKARADTLESEARAFVHAFGLTSVDTRAALTELQILLREHRREERDRAQLLASLEGLMREKQATLSTLQGTLRAHGIALPPQDDYTEVLEGIGRDLLAIKAAAAAEEERTAALAAARDRVAAATAAWTAALARLGLDGEKESAEAIDAVARDENTYRSLCAELSRRSAEHERFLAEHPQLEEEREEEKFDVEALTAREATLTESLRTSAARIAALVARIDALSVQADALEDAEEAVVSLRESLREAEENKATLDHTLAFLKAAKEGLSTRYLDGMQRSFTDYLTALTGEDTPESVLDASFDVSLRKGGKTHPAESFSRGWRDSLQLCLRLSLVDAMYGEGERPCLVLDDPFVNLDERRLFAAKRLLLSLSEKYQIVYMVCHEDRL